MKTIQLLQPAGEWPVGAVVVVEDPRADRLIRTGYAVSREASQMLSAGERVLSRKEARKLAERTH